MTPWPAARSARFSARAAYFTRSSSSALAASPPDSSSAFLQSIMPAPVGPGRRSVFILKSLLPLAPAPAPAPPRDGFGCWGRHLFGLQPGGDRLRLGPPLAARRPLLPLAILGLDARLGGVGRPFPF